MQCTNCKVPLKSGINYCPMCGHKIRRPLEQLRIYERGMKREFISSCEKTTVPHCTDLAKYAWLVASQKYHPSECKYSVNSEFIPKEAFHEVITTKHMAGVLFSRLAPIVKDYECIPMKIAAVILREETEGEP